jgi:glycosyltransferase involved in cell wall biosynthesis
MNGMEIRMPDSLLFENFEPINSPLRIAVVTETWPPEVNGVALTLSKLVQQLRLKQHAIQLVRPRQDKQDTASDQMGWSEMLMRGLPIPRYPQLKLGLPSKKALIRAWTQKRPDVVHIATEGPLGWSALQAARVLRLPVTSDFRTNFHSYSQHYGVGWLSKPIAAYLRKFHNRTLFTMVPTQALKNQLQGAGFDNLQVVARGVDTQLFHPSKRSGTLREQWQADETTTVLLSVGRLASEKNLDLVVNTYQALRQSGKRVKLVFAGDGPYRGKLLAQCPDAIFTGMCTQSDLAVVYASADLLLFPSLTETFGNVTLESLASGTPVLAFDCAAASELVQDTQNGWLVAGEDGQRYVLKALSITQNKSLLSEIRSNTHASIAHWDWLAIAAQFEVILRKAIAENPSA